MRHVPHGGKQCQMAFATAQCASFNTDDKLYLLYQVDVCRSPPVLSLHSFPGLWFACKYDVSDGIINYVWMAYDMPSLEFWSSERLDGYLFRLMQPHSMTLRDEGRGCKRSNGHQQHPLILASQTCDAGKG